MRTPDANRIQLSRWKTARRAVLGAIVLAGSVATSAVLVARMAAPSCASYQRAERGYTYSGIGVVIERQERDVVIVRVLDGTPADDKLFAGGRLVSVDGNTPGSLEDWTAAIRGPAGTNVEIEVAYPCGGQKTIELERAVIRLDY
jgi:C-terminal processing protease CtpA/Prc